MADIGPTLAAVSGTVFGVQRFSVHDGPGIRTSVFLKGCNMRCLWCHNPEGIAIPPQLRVMPQNCVHCGACVAACPNSAHQADPAATPPRHDVLWEKCTACGDCVNACPAGALELVGQPATAGEVLQKVLRDKRYYPPDGGVTLSGGEAMLQPRFAAAILQLCREEGVHTALETNGNHPAQLLIDVIPQVDLFLYDYKVTGEAAHKRWVGTTNTRILATLKALHDAGANIRLRCTIIPGVNDNDEHFAAIAALTKRLPRLEGAELLAYHDLGTAKSAQTGQQAHHFTSPAPEDLKAWCQKVAGFGGRLAGTSL